MDMSALEGAETPPGKGISTRIKIKPVALANGHGRYTVAVHTERARMGLLPLRL
jgi:hypothetical protein